MSKARIAVVGLSFLAMTCAHAPTPGLAPDAGMSVSVRNPITFAGSDLYIRSRVPRDERNVMRCLEIYDSMADLLVHRSCEDMYGEASAPAWAVKSMAMGQGRYGVVLTVYRNDGTTDIAVGSACVVGQEVEC